MGTDIHCAIEYKLEGHWRALLVPNPWHIKYPDEEVEFRPQLEVPRNYDVFSVLANVRNGYGFAGCPTSRGFPFISDHRGFPDDLSEDVSSILHDKWGGDHSDTWVSLPELLAYDWSVPITKVGVVSAKEFRLWDVAIYDKAPREWCNGMTGGGVVNLTNEEMRAMLKGKKWEEIVAMSTFENPKDGPMYYTRLEWQQTVAQCTPEIWTHILPDMLRMGRQFGDNNVRLVMNFDS